VLDAALGLTGIGTDPLDVELVECAGELRVSAATLRILAVHAKDARLVAVEGDRLAEALDICPSRLEVTEGRFRCREIDLHQTTRGIVDVDQDRACRPARLEPGVLAPVDLDQFPNASPPISRLMDPRRALLAWHPDAGLRHDSAHRLLCQHETMDLDELLASECGTEVGVPITNERDGLRFELGRRPIVTRTAAALRDQAMSTLSPISLHQTPELPISESQPLGGEAGLQQAVADGLNGLQSIEFAHADGNLIIVVPGHRGLVCPAESLNTTRGESGHLNLARTGHYNLAATDEPRIIHIMSTKPCSLGL